MTKKQRGRPPFEAGKAKSEIIQFRCTKEERLILGEKAKSKGLSVTGYLRSLAL